MVSSATNIGKANRKTIKRYINKKAAPPLLAAFVGKPHTLPKPTAEPAAAIIKPNFEVN